MATEAAAWNDAQRNVADASMCTGIVASRQVWCVNLNAMAPRTSRKHTPVVLARVAVGRAGGLVTVAVVRLGVRAAVVQRRRGNRRGIGHRVRHEQRHEASHRPVLVLRKASATAARRRRAPRACPSCQCVSSFEGTLASKHRGAARRRRRASWRRRRSGNGPAPSMIPVRGSARRPLAIDQGRQGLTLSFGHGRVTGPRPRRRQESRRRSNLRSDSWTIAADLPAGASQCRGCRASRRGCRGGRARAHCRRRASRRGSRRASRQ